MTNLIKPKQPNLLASSLDQASLDLNTLSSLGLRNPEVCIRDVWAENFFEEMEVISRKIDEFNYISMDTEYPGTVYLPSIVTKDFQYQLIKANVDNLKLIQLGITLSDSQGKVPEGVCTWQFNIEFDLSQEQYAQESLELLRNSGVEFHRHKLNGIPQQIFAEYLTTSGMFFNPNVHWITFHGATDFAYLLRILLGEDLPENQYSFIEALNGYFCNYYDIKEIKRDMYLAGSLSKIAKELEVERIGTVHQSGSDSIVTSRVFFKLKSMLSRCLLTHSIESQFEKQFNGLLFGLGLSSNEESYLEDYKSLVRQYSSNDGKLINMNAISSPKLGYLQHNDGYSSTSTTISTSSSINSLNNYQQINNFGMRNNSYYQQPYDDQYSQYQQSAYSNGFENYERSNYVYRYGSPQPMNGPSMISIQQAPLLYAQASQNYQ